VGSRWLMLRSLQSWRLTSDLGGLLLARNRQG
jgi:hypothetical protein